MPTSTDGLSNAEMAVATELLKQMTAAFAWNIINKSSLSTTASNQDGSVGDPPSNPAIYTFDNHRSHSGSYSHSHAMSHSANHSTSHTSRPSVNRPSTNTERTTNTERANLNGANTETEAPADTPIHSLDDQSPRITLKLDTLRLPIFDGDLTQWISFRDQFLDLVHNNRNFSAITKFHQLRTHLKGEAYAAIDGFKLSTSDYEAAWFVLEKRYNHPDKIIDEYLKQFVQLPVLQSNRRAAQVINMVNRTNQLLRVLPTLGVDVKNWDKFIMYTLRDKLDPPTLKKWIEQVKTRINIPLSELLDFLEVEATECVMLASESRMKPTGHQPPNNPRRNRYDRFRPTSMMVTANQNPCPLCKGDHPIWRCRTFLALSVNDRIKKVRQAGLCPVCLGLPHVGGANSCEFGNCPTCGSHQHNSLLCFKREKERKERARKNKTTETRENKPSPQVANITTINKETSTILATAMAKINNARPWCNQIRALCDSGSQLNLITSNAVKKLGLVAERFRLSMTGAQDSPLGDAVGRVILSIQLPKSTETIQTTMYIVDRISRQLPFYKISRSQPEFNELELADPSYRIPGEIDALFGVRVWLKIVEGGIIRSQDESAVAQQTKLGWVIYQAEPEHNLRNTAYVAFLATHPPKMERDNIDNILRRFWEIEELPKIKRRTPEEEECERSFSQGITRKPDGRYVVRLPFNDKINLLGKSYHGALKQYHSLERRLNADGALKEKYHAFMNEYASLGHMHIAQNHKEEGYYIPHHAVTAKFRVVFNGSYNTTSGISLNETLLVGEKQQDDLAITLMRFRTYPIALTADIVKMFRQVLIDERDRKYQRIFWRFSQEEPIQVYELATVTYGQAAAPFLSVRALRQCAIDHQEKFPIGAKHVLSSFYVDDLLTGADSIEEAMIVQKQISSTLDQGKFQLSKWCSNNAQVNSKLRAEFAEKEIRDTESTTILGLRWLPAEDAFAYKIDNSETDIKTLWTKRAVLSRIGKIYDPNGFISPITIVAKCIMQDLWKITSGWDDEVTPEVLEKWTRFLSTLSQLENVRIPRWLGTKAPWKTEICGFADASEKAYAAVIYLRTFQENGIITITLLGSKTRVAPLKPVTIPRLELCAAHLLSKFVSTVMEHFQERVQGVYLWTDSLVTYHWIGKHPSTLKTFVANRVAGIQEMTIEKGYKWHWTPGEDNPADLATRGATAYDLKENPIWWNGPNWLMSISSLWPEPPQQALNESDELLPEIRIVHSITATEELIRGKWFKYPTSLAVPIFEAYDSYLRTRNVIATVLRAIHNFRNQPEKRQYGRLTPEEKDKARVCLIQLHQRKYFHREIDDAIKNDVISPAGVNQWFDKETNILRLAGRIQNEDMDLDNRFPAIINPKGKLAELLIKHAHLKSLHGGTQQVLQLLRQQYWVPRARRVTKSIINKCTICFRYRLALRTQLMAPLPTARTTPERPFYKCGVDYAGPVGVLASNLRGAKTTKGWIAVFVCMSTRAIHLELVSRPDTPQFILALRRLVARRGHVREIWSDNGTNFAGANNFFKAIEAEDPQWSETVTKELPITWHFATPGAPHQGGFYEAAVKSVKKHLKRVLNDRNLTFEEFSTLLTQIEACVNSRPITPLSDDPSDLNALTPGHFLIGENLITLTEPRPLDYTKVSYQRRWEMLQAMYQHFWQRWHQEYLSTLINRTKWTQREQNIKIDDMVIMKEENLPPSRWRIGRIIDVFKAADGCVRSVRVRTETGDYNRPIAKLGVLFPQSTPDSSEEVNE